MEIYLNHQQAQQEVSDNDDGSNGGFEQEKLNQQLQEDLETYQQENNDRFEKLEDGYQKQDEKICFTRRMKYGFGGLLIIILLATICIVIFLPQQCQWNQVKNYGECQTCINFKVPVNEKCQCPSSMAQYSGVPSFKECQDISWLLKSYLNEIPQNIGKYYLTDSAMEELQKHGTYKFDELYESGDLFPSQDNEECRTFHFEGSQDKIYNFIDSPDFLGLQQYVYGQIDLNGDAHGIARTILINSTTNYAINNPFSFGSSDEDADIIITEGQFEHGKLLNNVREAQQNINRTFTVKCKVHYNQWQ